MIASLLAVIVGAVLVAAGLVLAVGPWAGLLWVGAVLIAAGLLYDPEG